jgi:K(+)-stimulated pyrophosphate-energized sodium pump
VKRSRLRGLLLAGAFLGISLAFLVALGVGGTGAEPRDPRLNLIWIAPVGSVIALLFAGYLVWMILRKSEGTERMRQIAKIIRQGAWAYLKRQYVVLGIFLLVMSAILGVMVINGYLALPVPFAFLTGGFFSALSGFVGMIVATNSSARTAQACRTSLNGGLRISFSSGVVMGLMVVGFGVLDLSVWYYILNWLYRDLEVVEKIRTIASTMVTFELGASSVALFARVGGGIYTKAADVGADIVGKVEAGIPEDDPRNPAAIADNVGDNVGDVAGMGADLYESYVGSIVATMALGAAAFASRGLGIESITVPLMISALGIVASILGTFFVRAGEKADQAVLLRAIRRGIYLSAGLIALGSFFIIQATLGLDYIGVYGSIMAGLVAGLIIGYSTEFFTSQRYWPTRSIAEQAQTGEATVVIAGLSVGMLSTLIPVLAVAGATLAAYAFAYGFTDANMGLYGIGIAAVGMLSTLGITLATDSYGPVADNAAGNAEMAGLPPIVRERASALDALGNTTAATGKGFAIGSAALTALALISAFKEEVLKFILNTPRFAEFLQAQGLVPAGFAEMSPVQKLQFFEQLPQALREAFLARNFNLSLENPMVIAGLLIGAMVPFIFCSITMRAVGRAASKIVLEVRRQFREIQGLLEGKAEPDSARAVDIVTRAAQREMILPALMAIVTPLLVGIFLGVSALVGLLIGALASGFVVAVMMANAGGAWDNAKKYIEEGAYGGKGTFAHKASITGDTVGDPFKDTSGPSLNILIKLMSMVSVVFAAFIVAKAFFK